LRSAAPAPASTRANRGGSHVLRNWLLQNYGQTWPNCRFDVVTVDGNGKIEWIRDAFAI
jgi:Holliday junction resolvase-like predicted endonuclease